ncbi:Enoyl-CoA hydratase domain-containing protein 3, mitochondrial [Balamuthia mandrillaris]
MKASPPVLRSARGANAWLWGKRVVRHNNSSRASTPCAFSHAQARRRTTTTLVGGSLNRDNEHRRATQKLCYSSSSPSSSPSQPQSSPAVLLHKDVTKGVATVTLNNPKTRNALSMSTLQQLQEILNDLRQDSSMRAVLLRALPSGGGSVFSSGHNLKELHGQTQEYYQQLFRLCSEVMQSIRALPLPVIAQVDGLATAAGAQLVASCDIVIATERSAFATPGVKIGLFCTTPGVAIARSLSSSKKAMEMLLTGEPISANEAYLFGLVNRVVPSPSSSGKEAKEREEEEERVKEELEKETWKVLEKITKSSAAVNALGKRAFYRQMKEGWDAGRAYENVAEPVMVQNALLPDAQEGIAAFLQKRPPSWPSTSAKAE